MPIEPTSWERANKDRARNAFGRARLDDQTNSRASKGSEMVRASCPSLQDGPKPPGPIYNAMKARAFNESWEKERVGAMPSKASKSKLSYEEFMRGAQRESGMGR